MSENNQQDKKKKGYCKVPHELLNKYMRIANSYETRLLLAAIEKTYGWHKQSDKISISQLQELTGIKDSRNIYRALRRLQKQKILNIEKRIMSPNQNYQEWRSWKDIKDSGIKDTKSDIKDKRSGIKDGENVTLKTETKDNIKDTIQKISVFSKVSKIEIGDSILSKENADKEGTSNFYGRNRTPSLAQFCAKLEKSDGHLHPPSPSPPATSSTLPIPSTPPNPVKIVEGGTNIFSCEAEMRNYLKFKEQNSQLAQEDPALAETLRVGRQARVVHAIQYDLRKNGIFYPEQNNSSLLFYFLNHCACETGVLPFVSLVCRFLRSYSQRSFEGLLNFLRENGVDTEAIMIRAKKKDDDMRRGLEETRKIYEKDMEAISKRKKRDEIIENLKSVKFMTDTDFDEMEANPAKRAKLERLLFDDLTSILGKTWQGGDVEFSNKLYELPYSIDDFAEEHPMDKWSAGNFYEFLKGGKENEEI